MSRAVIEAVVKRLSGKSRAYRVEKLTGGLTNQNFRIELADGVYVASLHDKRSALLGIDRDVEYHNSREASRSGIAPRVVLQLPGVLVSRFVDGKVLKPGDLKKPQLQKRVIATLRQCHQIHRVRVRGFFSVFRDVEHHFEVSQASPRNLRWIRKQMRRIEHAFREQPYAPMFCHNDTVPENMIDAGKRIVLIDWEYAGIGDPFFDLGMIARYHELNEGQERSLVRAYFGTYHAGALARLRLMRIMSDLRDASWSLVQAENSPVDFDYEQYGKERFQRFIAACTHPQFEAWLHTAASIPRLTTTQSGGKNA